MLPQPPYEGVSETYVTALVGQVPLRDLAITLRRSHQRSSNMLPNVEERQQR